MSAGASTEQILRRARRMGLLDDAALESLLNYFAAPGRHLPLNEALGHFGLNDVAVALVTGDTSLAAHRIAPHLTVLGTVGQGGMGTVYRAHDARLNRVVAVKVLRAHDAPSPRALSRFEREAQVMAQIDHPSCVKVFEAGLTATCEPYLVMPLVPGNSMERLIRDAPRGLGTARVAAWGRSIALALHACHEQGVVHRDVKPSNILITPDDRALLTDFGIAFTSDTQRLTQAGSMIGTLAYMPPEQLRADEDDPPDLRSDVYALGSTLYHALTGRLLFESNQPAVLIAKVTTAEPEPPSHHRPDLPPSLEQVILRCLDKDVEQRYPSALALAEALGESSPPEEERNRATTPHGRFALVGGALALGVAVGFLAGRLSPTASPESTPGLAAAEQRAQAAEARANAAERALARARAQAAPPSPAVPPPPRSAEERRAPPGVKWLGGNEYRNLKDGSVLVYVPPGEFVRGSDQYGVKEEMPAHLVELTAGYLIGKYEVTWKQFLAFCRETGSPVPSNKIDAFRAGDQHPVFNVGWEGARSYCEWAGLRLPTEAEWEFAARGTDGRHYPWGKEFPTTWLGANVGDHTLLNTSSPEGRAREIVRTCRDHFPYTAPVGRFPAGASPVGCLDMAGNVHEWVSDRYGPYGRERLVDPTGPKKTTKKDPRVFRGGSWAKGSWAVRTVARFNYDTGRALVFSGTDRMGFQVGFRVARSLAPGAE